MTETALQFVEITNQTTWPAAFVLVAMVLAAAFIFWVMMK